VTSEAWAWVNGRFAGHRPYQQAYLRPAELDLDVTRLVKAGRNVIGVLVRADCLTEAAEGFQGPLFLYAPNTNSSTEQALGLPSVPDPRGLPDNGSIDSPGCVEAAPLGLRRCRMHPGRN
jgi:hypothetical protein